MPNRIKKSDVEAVEAAGARIDRHFLPSPVKRGELSAAPKYTAYRQNGQVASFTKQSDAIAFALNGCKHYGDHDLWRLCKRCQGKKP